MKTLPNIIIAAAVGAAAAYGVMALRPTPSVPPAAAEAASETAYERVMRTGVLRCGYTVYDPYLTKNPNTGKIGGFTAEMVEALGRILNLKVEWTYEYFQGGQVEALKSRKADALCIDGPWTRSAMPYLIYSHALYFLPSYAWVADGSPHREASFGAMNDTNIIVTAMDGDGSQDMAAAFLPKAKMLSIPNSADPALMLENVATGKADIVLTDPTFIEAYNATHERKLVEMSPRRVIATYPVLMTALPQETLLIDMLNRALDYGRDTGLSEQILQRYDADGSRLLPPSPTFKMPVSP